jgi:hypothetical protein
MRFEVRTDPWGGIARLLGHNAIKIIQTAVDWNTHGDPFGLAGLASLTWERLTAIPTSKLAGDASSQVIGFNKLGGDHYD